MEVFFKILNKIEIWLTVLAMVAFTIIGFLQVFFRVVVENPIGWSEEACKYLFVWSTMLGAVLVSANNGHFCVDMLTSLMPKKVSLLFKYLLSYTIIFMFSLILIVYGFQLVFANTIRVTPALGIKIMYIYSIIPISGILVILHLIEDVYKTIKIGKAQ